MKHFIYFFAICVLTFSIIGNANAQVPQTISYQGLLTTSSGAPIPDGNYNLTFSLYTVPTGGTAIWTETQSSVPVSKGTFSVVLGSTTPFTGVDFAQQLYLGITKDSDPEFSPRSALTSAPSAFVANAVSGNGNVVTTGTINSTGQTSKIRFHYDTLGDLPDANTYHGAIAHVHSEGKLYYAHAGVWVPVSAEGHTHSTLASSDGSPDPALSVDADGNVGIGTTTPNEQLEITGNLRLPVSTASVGVIKSGDKRFIHNYQVPGTNGQNTFIGLEAGNFTMSGSGTNASFNTGVGYKSLYSLTIGNFNSALGVQSLSYNTTGYDNSAFGTYSLYNNTTGNSNSAFGSGSLINNAAGNQNSAFGFFSLPSNTTGNSNSAFGHWSLYFNTTGSFNTAIGLQAGSNITTGSNNIAIGYFAQVPTGTADNQIRLGNTSITYAGIQVAWTVTSDRRYKENIQPLNLGLGFISKLNPVSYHRKADEKQRTEYGLIAQEVEQVLKDCGVENPGMLTITDEGMYELRYNDLLAPMIKAIQELGTENKELRTKNQELAERLSTLETMVKSLVEQKQDKDKKLLGELLK